MVMILLQDLTMWCLEKKTANQTNQQQQQQKEITILSRGNVMNSSLESGIQIEDKSEEGKY